MKLAKTVLSTLMLSLILNGAAFAGQIGIVDMQEVSQKYSKAQTVNSEAKTKEEELQKVRQSLADQLKAGEKLSPVEKKNLEDKLNAQFAEKVKGFREWMVGQETTLKQNFDTAINAVAKEKQLDLVLPKQTVLQGGQDITQDVINLLNK